MEIIGLVDNYISKEEENAARYIIEKYGDKTGKQKNLIKQRELLKDLFLAIVNAKEEVIDGYLMNKIRIFKEDICELEYLKEFLVKCEIGSFLCKEDTFGCLIFYLTPMEKQELDNYIFSREDLVKTLKKN